MNQKDYLKKLLKNGVIRFSYAGSEFGNDCILLVAGIFMDYETFTLYIPSMTWENIEEYIADIIDSDIRNNVVRLKLDIIEEDGKTTYVIWNNETNAFYSAASGLIHRFPSKQDAYDWLCEKYKDKEIL